MLIPQGITEFLLEHFHKKCFKGSNTWKKNHIQAIELEEINELMNEIWEGPGSMNKIATLTNEMRIQRLWTSKEEEEEKEEDKN